MALTAEQKDAGKISRRYRDRAWRARCKLRAMAEAVGLALIEREHDPRINEVRHMDDDLRNHLQLKLKEIDDQIEALRATRKIIVEDKAEIIAARKAFHDALIEKSKAEKELQDCLDREYPDLIGDARWSAAVWGALTKGGE